MLTTQDDRPAAAITVSLLIVCAALSCSSPRRDFHNACAGAANCGGAVEAGAPGDASNSGGSQSGGSSDSTAGSSNIGGSSDTTRGGTPSGGGASGEAGAPDGTTGGTSVVNTTFGLYSGSLQTLSGQFRGATYAIQSDGIFVGTSWACSANYCVTGELQQ
jgi:hypothetical protein